eukprot:4853759-Pyramimonas_sp.AAC.1
MLPRWCLDCGSDGVPMMMMSTWCPSCVVTGIAIVHRHRFASETPASSPPQSTQLSSDVFFPPSQPPYHRKID